MILNVRGDDTKMTYRYIVCGSIYRPKNSHLLKKKHDNDAKLGESSFWFAETLPLSDKEFNITVIPSWQRVESKQEITGKIVPGIEVSSSFNGNMLSR